MKTNRLKIPAMLLAVLLAGCGDADRSKLVGSWKIETAEDVADRIGVESDLTQDESFPRMSLVFENSGKLETSTRMGNIDRTKTGRWNWKSFDVEKLTAVIECEIGMQKTQHDVVWIDDNTIELIPPNMAGLTMKLRFVR